MRRSLTFAHRTLKEVMREPINIFFGIAFPVLMLIIMTMIFKNIPGNPMDINFLTPGIAIFGLSFLTIFSGLTIAKDRSSAFLERLYTTPIGAVEIIVGYTLPIIGLGLIQAIVLYIVGLIMGLTPTPHIMVAILTNVPTAILFIAIGLLAGSLLSEKAVGGAVGSILPVLASLLGGCWMDLSIMGEGVQTFAMCLPFANAVELEKCIIAGTYVDAWKYFLVVLAYTVVTCVGAVLAFLKQMKKH